MTPPDSIADKLLAEDKATERRLLWSEIGIIAFVTFLVGCYLVFIR